MIAWMTPEVQRQIVNASIAVAVLLLFTGQCRKPRWWPGRLFAAVMNVQHSGVTDWGLEQVRLEKRFTLLDVGCGGGRTIQKLAAVASEGQVFGVDYSPTSVAAARHKNAESIASGRVQIQQASVSHLPFPDGTFDVVTAVETHYYWPDFVADLREILRVLKPGGRLVIIAETYKGRRFDALYRPIMMLLRATYLTVDEHREALSAAGYAEIAVIEQRSKGWICAMGRKPANPAA
jgi:SAM-dependent methyltransferase